MGAVLGVVQRRIAREGPRILLVYPPKATGASTAYGEAVPLALLHRQKEAQMSGWGVSVLNLADKKDPAGALDRAMRTYRPQVVGFSTTSPSEAMAFSLAKHLRHKGLGKDVLLVKGGPGSSHSFPEVRRILGGHSPIDAIFLGDADASFRPFLNAVQSGSARAIESMPGVGLLDAKTQPGHALSADISRRVFPDAADILRAGERPFPTLMWSPNKAAFEREVGRLGRIQTMTNCAFGCAFCNVSNLVGAQTRISPAEAAHQIRLMVGKGIRAFYFEDATFLVDRIKGGAFTKYRDVQGDLVPGQRFSGWSAEFLQEMRKIRSEEESKGHKVRFGIQTRLDSLDNQAIRDLAGAGCTNVFLGVETLAKPSLGRMHKGTRNEDAELERIFLNLRENGINSTVSLIVGKYTGGIENFRHTLERLDALGASEFFLQAGAVYPGTGDWKAMSPKKGTHVVLSYLAPGHLASGVRRRNLNPEDQGQYLHSDWEFALRKYYATASKLLGRHFVRMNPGHFLRKEIFKSIQ
jgi:radical SAM superfamily enzyme YgiQ (UPF0313 family)